MTAICALIWWEIDDLKRSEWLSNRVSIKIEVFLVNLLFNITLEQISTDYFHLSTQTVTKFKAVSGRQYHWSILKLTLKMFLWFFIFNVLWKFVNLQPDDFEGILRDLDLIFVEEDSLLNDGKIEKSFNSHATNWF